MQLMPRIIYEFGPFRLVPTGMRYQEVVNLVSGNNVRRQIQFIKKLFELDA